jgi:hypothetical protein
LDSKDASIRPGDVGAVRRAADAGGGAGLGGRVGLRGGLDIGSYASVGTMAEVGVRRPTARALVLESTYHSQVRALIYTNLLLLRTGTHTRMKEPLTCVDELEALAQALETELEPLVAHQLAELLATIRSSDADRKRFVGVPVEVPEEEAVRKVADKCPWFVTAARGQGGFVWGRDIRDSTLTRGLQMTYFADSIVNHSAEAWQDSESRRAAKGCKAGGRQPASKGRGVQRRQGDKRAGKAVGKRLASVVAGGGRRGPSAGAGRPTARNPLRPSARAGRSGDRRLEGRCRPCQMG